MTYPAPFLHASAIHRKWMRTGLGNEARLAEAIERWQWSDEQLLAFRQVRLEEYLAGLGQMAGGETTRLADLAVMAKSAVPVAPRSPGLFWRPKQRSSGTTGSPVEIPIGIDRLREQWTVWRRHWHSLGVESNQWQLSITGRQSKRLPPIVVDRVNHRLIVGANAVTPGSIHEIAENARRYGCTWIHGFPSVIAELCELAARCESSRAWIESVTLVTTSSEQLTDWAISMVEGACGVSPRQHYGLAEGVANLSSCEGGRLHVDEDFSMVEFVPFGEGLHEIVGTPFGDVRVPLARYRTGDLVELAGQACECGRPGRAVNNIVGRLDDYLLSDSGRKVFRLGHAFWGKKWIAEAQIRQESPGSARVEVVIARPVTGISIVKLEQELSALASEDIRFAVEIVKSIAQPGKGKRKFIVRESNGR